jgi:hypothetical protein
MEMPCVLRRINVDNFFLRQSRILAEKIRKFRGNFLLEVLCFVETCNVLFLVGFWPARNIVIVSSKYRIGLIKVTVAKVTTQTPFAVISAINIALP